MPGRGKAVDLCPVEIRQAFQVEFGDGDLAVNQVVDELLKLRRALHGKASSYFGKVMGFTKSCRLT